MPFHSTWIQREISVMLLGSTAPDPTKFFFCLADSSTLTDSSTAAAFFAAELPIGTNGYSRKPITFTGPSIYDNAAKTAMIPTQTISWTPVGGSLQFQTAFLIADGAATGTAGTIVMLNIESQTTLRLAGQPYQVEYSVLQK